MSLLVASAHACGGFVPQSGALAASDAQQALFELGNDSITVTYRARYEGNAADFAWVLAVPGAIAEVVEGDADLLDDVAAASAPHVEVDPAVDDPGCGCGAATKGDLGDARSGGDSGGDTGVVVTGEGFAGAYTYTTLAASDADSLVTWLTDHGYDVALVRTAVEAYVADPLGYEFVAVQLQPDEAETGGNGVQLDPLSIRYGAASDGAMHASFPATLGLTSSVEYVRTELFVLGTGTATLTGWETAANADTEPGDVVLPDYVGVEGAYAQHLLDLGGAERRMWLAWSGAYSEDRWLTRFDAMVTPATNTVDPAFTDSGTRTEASTVIYVMEESAYEAAYPAGSYGVLGLLGVWAVRRMRQRP